MGKQATATAPATYKVGKPYAPRATTAQGNATTWAAIQAAMAANGGNCTMAQLQQAVAPYNHAPFIGYCLRRGWLVQGK